MARDFEDVNDLDDLNDDELRGLVVEHLAAHNALDIDDLTVEAHNGKVILAGRVGTDGERLVAERVVTDVLGIREFSQRHLRRSDRAAQSAPKPPTKSIVEDDRREGLLLGDRPVPISPEAEDSRPSLDAELYGTTDVHIAIEDGTAWIPPESPTQEGLLDRGDGRRPLAASEKHAGIGKRGGVAHVCC